MLFTNKNRYSKATDKLRVTPTSMSPTDLPGCYVATLWFPQRHNLLVINNPKIIVSFTHSK